MKDDEARKSVGVSKLRLSRLLGVDRNTLSIYEAAPERIGALRRAAFGFAYAVLRLAADGIALARLAIRRGKRDE